MIFGPKRLPELGQSIGKMFAEFKTAVNKGSEEADQDAKEAKEEKNNQTIFKNSIEFDCIKGIIRQVLAIDEGGNHDYYDFVTHFLFQLYRILMLVGRKNCRKIVQFLVEPLIKK